MKRYGWINEKVEYIRDDSNKIVAVEISGNGIWIPRTDLISKAPEMYELLKEVQFHGYEFATCAICGSDEGDGHAPECKLGKLLKELKELEGQKMKCTCCHKEIPKAKIRFYSNALCDECRKALIEIDELDKLEEGAG